MAGICAFARPSFPAHNVYYVKLFCIVFASSGHYVQSDPIGVRDGLTSYAYAYSNPGSNFDSTGLKPCRHIVSIKGMAREEQVLPGVSAGSVRRRAPLVRRPSSTAMQPSSSQYYVDLCF